MADDTTVTMSGDTTDVNASDDDDDFEEETETDEYVRSTRRWRVAIGYIWTIVQFLWGLSLLAAAFLKIWENTFINFIEHFTNISWTLQAYFYIGTAIGPVWIAQYRRSLLPFVTFLIAAFLMPLWGIVFAVAGIILVLMATNAKSIQEVFAEFPPAIVMLGNDIYHFVPVIALLIYFALNKRHVFYSLNLALQHNHWVYRVNPYTAEREVESVRKSFSVPMFLYEAYLGSLIPVLFYIAVFNPRVVYGTELSFAAGMLIFIGLLTISNALPLLLGFCGWRLGERRLTQDYIFQ
jgi:hypothetical protein